MPPAGRVLCFVLVAAAAIFTTVAYLRSNPLVWEAASPGQDLVWESDGGRLGLYESATYGTVFELVSEANTSVPLEPKDGLTVDKGGRTFTLFAEADLDSGEYTLRSTASPFAHDDAVVAVGDGAEAEFDRMLTAVSFGFGAALVLGLGLLFLSSVLYE